MKRAQNEMSVQPDEHLRRLYATLDAQAAVVGAARDVDESCNWHGPNEVGGDHCFGGFTANTNKPIRSLHTALRALAPAEQPQARSAR